MEGYGIIYSPFKRNPVNGVPFFVTIGQESLRGERISSKHTNHCRKEGVERSLAIKCYFRGL